MTVRAALYFHQGANTSPSGTALLGVTGTQVVVHNGDDTNVDNWHFEMLDVPPGSVVPTGVVADGVVPTFSFTPDRAGGYHFHLVVTDQFGNEAEDFRVFQVPEASGRIIPPYRAIDTALNWFVGITQNLRGWAPVMETWLRYLDTITPGNGAQTTFTSDATVTTLGTLAIPDDKATTLDFIVKGKDRVTTVSFSKQFHFDYARHTGGAPAAAANPDIPANNIGGPAWPGVTFVMGSSAIGVDTILTVKVQGAVATTIDWSLISQTLKVP